MRIDFAEIWEGWRNHLLPPERLREVISQVSQERLEICRNGPCQHHSSVNKTLRFDEHCTECGCPLVAKTKCLSCKCGIQKWLAVLTEEQEESINMKSDETQKGSSEAPDRNADEGLQ